MRLTGLQENGGALIIREQRESTNLRERLKRGRIDFCYGRGVSCRPHFKDRSSITAEQMVPDVYQLDRYRTPVPMGTSSMANFGLFRRLTGYASPIQVNGAAFWSNPAALYLRGTGVSVKRVAAPLS